MLIFKDVYELNIFSIVSEREIVGGHTVFCRQFSSLCNQNLSNLKNPATLIKATILDDEQGFFIVPTFVQETEKPCKNSTYKNPATFGNTSFSNLKNIYKSLIHHLNPYKYYKSIYRETILLLYATLFSPLVMGRTTSFTKGGELMC